MSRGDYTRTLSNYAEPEARCLRARGVRRGISPGGGPVVAEADGCSGGPSAANAAHGVGRDANVLTINLIGTPSARRNLYVRWLQEVRQSRPATVSRRMSVVAGLYPTCVVALVVSHIGVADPLGGA